MTKKDFFSLLLKIFGLYMIIKILFSTFPNTISFIFQEIDLIGLIWFVFVVVTIIGLFIYLLRNPGQIVDSLKLAEGFEEDRIDFGYVNSLDLIKFAILFIGGFLFIENIPAFFIHTLFAFKSEIPKSFDQAYYNTDIIKYHRIEDFVIWGSSAFNLIIGYLLFTKFERISNFLYFKKIGHTEDLSSTEEEE